jgi:serine protease AprX
MWRESFAGNGASSTGSAYKVTLRGIAPNASLINLRVLDSNGVGSDSYVIAAIQRAIQLKSQYNIRIMNLSLGRPVAGSYQTDPLCQAVEAAWKAGIVVVVAAGNAGRDNSQSTSGYGTITAPGNDPYAITVGAMKTLGTPSRADDLIASYSSKGPTFLDHIVKPDIVAPGNRIVSDSSTGMNLAKNYPTNRVDYSYYMISGTGRSQDYFTLSGTSMATPMVSGAAALLLQQNPNLTPDQVKARLMKTASKSFPSYSNATDPVAGTIYTSQYDIFTVGAGYLDAWAALNNSDMVPTGKTALSPTAVYDPTTGKVTIVNGNSVIWGDSLWNTSMVWGTSVFVNGTSVVWGDSIVWGDTTTAGFSVVWGDALVWGTSRQTSSESVSVAINGEN